MATGMKQRSLKQKYPKQGAASVLFMATMFKDAPHLVPSLDKLQAYSSEKSVQQTERRWEALSHSSSKCVLCTKT